MSYCYHTSKISSGTLVIMLKEDEAIAQSPIGPPNAISISECAVS